MDVMFGLLREGFVRTHRTEVLDEFRKGCIRVIVADLVGTKGTDPLEAYEQAEEMLPAVPAKGTLDIEQVLESGYFFA